MAASFSPADILAEIGQRGILRPCKFLIRMGVPAKMTRSALTAQAGDGTLGMWCESAQLPAVALESYKVRRYGYGALETKPIAPVYAEAQMTFRSDATGLVHDFFHAWMKMVVNYSFNGSINDQTGTLQPFEIGYKADYVQDVQVSQYDDAGNEILSITLRDASPIAIDTVPLSWAAVNDVSRVPVTLSYFGWFNNNVAAAAS